MSEQNVYERALMRKEALDMAVARISLMKFFPASNEHALATILVELTEMCSTDEQILWLAKQFTAVYKSWPGIGELRAFFCYVYKPADGVNANSASFPDGIPRELLGTPPGRPALSDGKPLQLTAPQETMELSANPEANDLVHNKLASEMPTMPRPRTKEEIEAELYKLKTIEPRGEIKPSKPGIISNADFEALETGEVQ